VTNTAADTTRPFCSSMVPTTGTIGAHNDETQNVQDCAVTLAGDLELCERSLAYRDLVQVFNFDDFVTTTTTALPTTGHGDHVTTTTTTTTTTTESLKEFMARSRDKLDCLDDVEISDSAGMLLQDIHERFLPIVENIIGHKGIYASRLQGADFSLAMTGTAQARHASDQYAGYLHNDIWMKEVQGGGGGGGGEEEGGEAQTALDENSNIRVKQCCAPPPPRRLLNHRVALVNIWFVLNETPPKSNTLVFYETSADKTRQAHMLHGLVDDVQDCTVVYDETMCWGRFYLFVSGQVDTSERILLHGALNMDQDQAQRTGVVAEAVETRRSVEMRYNVYV
jgi:hypothetical protein